MASVSGGTPPRTVTCASFTPPADSLFLAMWAGNTGSGSSPSQPLVTSSPSHSWTVDGWDWRLSGSPTEEGQAAAFHTYVSGSPGSSTVTVSSGESNTANGSILKMYVITGANSVDSVGVVVKDRQAGGSSLTDSYTASITGGQGFMVVCDWAAGATAGWTADTGCTMVDKGVIAGEISYAVVRRTDPDGVIGSPTAVGITGLPASGQYHWVLIEVISIEAALAADSAAVGSAGSPNAEMF